MHAQCFSLSCDTKANTKLYILQYVTAGLLGNCVLGRPNNEIKWDVEQDF